MLARWSARTLVSPDRIPGRLETSASSAYMGVDYRRRIIPDVMRLSLLFAAAALLMSAPAADAQIMSYGTSITLDAAKRAAAPAMAEALKNKWMMAVAIVDTAGDLVYFEKMDDT